MQRWAAEELTAHQQALLSSNSTRAPGQRGVGTGISELAASPGPEAPLPFDDLLIGGSGGRALGFAGARRARFHLGPEGGEAGRAPALEAIQG